MSDGRPCDGIIWVIEDEIRNEQSVFRVEPYVVHESESPASALHRTS